MNRFTYQERTLYGTLAADLLVYVPYVMQSARTNSISRIAGTMLLLIVVQMVLQAIIAAATRNRLQDERDQLIQLRGYRAGYFAFATLVVLGLSALWFHAEMMRNINPTHMAIHFLSVMFGMLVLADIVRVLTQLIAYRRSV